MVNKNTLAIGAWMSQFGDSYLGHAKGLSAEQVEALQELKEGDRLIVYINSDKKNEYSPDITIKVYSRKEQS